MDEISLQEFLKINPIIVLASDNLFIATFRRSRSQINKCISNYILEQWTRSPYVLSSLLLKNIINDDWSGDESLIVELKSSRSDDKMSKPIYK